MGDNRPPPRGTTMKKGGGKRLITEEEDKNGEADDAPTRDILPFFKDPKVKISLWTILKDSIGKDLSKITVPVYFNEPLSIL
jgi:hypothetical protein